MQRKSACCIIYYLYTCVGRVTIISVMCSSCESIGRLSYTYNFFLTKYKCETSFGAGITCCAMRLIHSSSFSSPKASRGLFVCALLGDDRSKRHRIRHQDNGISKNTWRRYLDPLCNCTGVIIWIHNFAFACLNLAECCKYLMYAPVKFLLDKILIHVCTYVYIKFKIYRKHNIRFQRIQNTSMRTRLCFLRVALICSVAPYCYMIDKIVIIFVFAQII